MFNLPRLATPVAVAASLALFGAACSTDSRGPLSPSFSANSAGSSSFAVLANAAVTCTDGTITGDVGTFQATPTGSVTLTTCPVVGTVHVGDGASIAAYNAFLAEYAALASVPCDVVLTGTLAGVTLAPGVYCFDAAATLTGVLTLNGPASGTWLFKVGNLAPGALTGTNFSVVMAGGGQECNVTWWVDAAATMTDSDFIGNILAGAGITLTRGTFAGNIWAQADVTITGTALAGCEGGNGNGSGNGNDKRKCNQGVGNGPEGCDPGNSNNRRPSNDETGGTPGNPGRKH
jgi:ice-binding like protein